MSIRDGPSQSKNDEEFIIRSLRSGRRVDGRKLGEMRLLRMVFARAEGQASAEIQLGRTRVLAVVTGEVVPPFPDRPTEGFLHFNVELGPMAAPSAGERNSPVSVEIARIIEIGVRDSQALDTEALCIIGGEKVWQLRCDVHILDHGGNLIDACTLATMAALRHFRRPEVTIDGSKVLVHHTDEKEPHPLALHHVPICVTFAIFEDTGDSGLGRPGGGGRSGKGVGGMSGAGVSSSKTQHTAVDPTEVEEEVMKGRITFALTAHKELCALHKNGGVAITKDTILGCARLAAVKVEEIHKVLDEALAGADAKAVQDRQRRLRGTVPSAADQGPTAKPIPNSFLGAGPGTLPGTKSTPFVVAQAPMPVAAESLEVKHLDYDDLNVTQGIREEGLRGGGNRGGRGLDIADARSTDLFAKMAKAASMTEARISQEEKDGEALHPPTAAASAPSPRNQNGAAAAATVTAGLDGGGGVGRSGRGADTNGKESGVRIQAGGSHEGGVGDTASDEFARLAETLKADSRKVRASGAGGMDVDSDEEETLTLEGEFKAADGSGVKVVTREEGRDGGAGEEEDDDLLAAVKVGKGKGRVRGKNRAKGKKEKSVA